MKAAHALASWLRGVSDRESAVDAAQRKLAQHVAKAPTSPDPAEHRAWLRTKRDLEDDVAAEEAALQVARAEAARAKDAADKAEKDAEERRVRKLNDELAKVVLELGAKFERLAPEVERYKQMLREVEAWNANRGDRPFIVDGEKRVRELPEKHFPTVYETLTVWVDPKTGRRPSQYREVNGELVPSDHDGAYVKTTEKVVSRNARTKPAEIPGGRFKDSVRLIGLKGESLFGRDR
jgi:hypothetical protein